jgi:hypothetical protein
MHTTSLAAAIRHLLTSMPCQLTGCNTGAPPAWKWSAMDAQGAQCVDQDACYTYHSVTCWTAVTHAAPRSEAEQATDTLWCWGRAGIAPAESTWSAQTWAVCASRS